MFASILQAVASSDDDGLTMAEIVADIPHDGPAIFVYVLLAVALFAVVYFGVSSSGPGGGSPARP